MATKSKKAKTKATRKKGGARNKTPKIENCPFIADVRRPHTTESSGKLAVRGVSVIEAVVSWTKDIRKAFADGTKKSDLPEFPVGKHANPNTGRMSRSAHSKLIDEYNDAIDEDRKLPALPPRYNPVEVDLLHAMNATSLRRGVVASHPKPPKDWDEKEYGSWYHDVEMEDGTIEQEASGWFFDKIMPRRNHAVRAENLVTDPETNILSFGNLRIVCGSGTHDGSAVFIVNQTSHGNYRAGDITRKRMSFAGVKELRDIVFRIEDRANNEGGFTVKGNWIDAREMVYMPGQVLTAGFLYDAKGKVIDAKAIRKLDGDTKGLKFKALEAPIVGKIIPWSKLWTEIQVADRKAIKAMRERGGRSEDNEAGSTQAKAITNICVNGKRVDPNEANCFGLRGSQCNMPAFIVATGEGKIEEGHFGMGVILGERANAAHNVGVHAARAGVEVEEAETPAPKTKAKAAKPKVAKAKAAKPEAPKATKPKSDAAPPEQANTVSEPETAETKTAETVEPATA